MWPVPRVNAGALRPGLSRCPEASPPYSSAMFFTVMVATGPSRFRNGSDTECRPGAAAAATLGSMRHLKIVGISVLLTAIRLHAQDSTVLALPPVDLAQHTGFAIGAAVGAASGTGEAYEFTDPGFEIQGFVAATWSSPDQIRLGFSFGRHDDQFDPSTPITVLTGSAEALWAITGNRWKLLAGPMLTVGRMTGGELRDLSGWGAGLSIAARWNPIDRLALELGWTVRGTLYSRPSGSMDPDGIAPGTVSVFRIGTVWEFPGLPDDS